MNLLSLILIAIAVSIDGFWGGFAFGLRKIKINVVALLIISLWAVMCTFVSMLIGHHLKGYIPIGAAKYIGAALLILLGLFTLREGYKQKKELAVNNPEPEDFHMKDIFKVLHNPLLADVDKQNDIKPMEANILGIAVAMDASVAAFTISLIGVDPFTTPLLFGLTHFILIGLGNIIARHRRLKKICERFSMLPGIILVLLGLARLV